MDSKPKTDVGIPHGEMPAIRLDESKVRRTNRWLVGVVVVLAIAVVGLGAALVVQAGSEEPAPSPTNSIWSASSAADVALVDEVLAIWTDNDVDAVDTVFAEDARVISADAPEAESVRGIKETRMGVRFTVNTYERIGPVSTATEPPGGLTSLPEGNRFLFFPMLIHDDVFESAFEVNGDGIVETIWVFMPTETGAFA